MNSNEMKVLIIACFGHFVCHYNITVFPALVVPLAERLHWSVGQVVELSFLQFLLFGLGALPWGMLGDRFGARPLIVLMLLGCAFSSLVAAFTIESPGIFYLALGGIGLFSGIYHPVGMGMISLTMGRVNLAMAYNAIFGGLGMVVAPILTGGMNYFWGPRSAYVFVGILNFTGLAVMALLGSVENRPSGKQDIESAEGLKLEFGIMLAAMTFAGIVTTGSTVILPAFLELKSSDLTSMISHIVPFSTSANLTATAIASMVYLVGIGGQFAGGITGDRYEPKWVYFGFYFACIPLALFMAYTQGPTLAVLSGVYFFFLLGTQSVENTVTASLTPKSLRHSAFGLKYILYFGVGAFSVKLVSFVSTSWGIEAVFVSLGLITGLILLTMLWLIYLMRPVRIQTQQSLLEVRPMEDMSRSEKN
ncbi:MFS transporter [Desulfomonile tiedjei]|uniref:Nitrate/nitrite transporter n=1 Tax=Desulfomonile tiedjei (strain ATCC 49306 / DSM 6799 / DCB-1) TaxID=706587 RepID=I4C1Y7_DESTA|nr:MFS transporter [Desulfomonile tiedjei]AFM23578.1 nitrate/nitrite transporter [Desulfomonile tiedjei DSM 6799]